MNTVASPHVALNRHSTGTGHGGDVPRGSLNIYKNKMPYIELKNEDSGERQILHIPPEGIKIGRSKSCKIVLDRDSISKVHAKINCQSGNWYIEDTSSRNGFLVNGERTEWHWLRDNDIISLPHYKMTFFLSGADGKKHRSSLAREAAAEDNLKRKKDRLPPVHPFALASIFFFLLSLLHWAFSVSGIVLCALSLYEIRRSKKYRGQLIATALLAGGVLLALSGFFIEAGGMEMFLVPDTIKTHCRTNMEVIWDALQEYKENAGNRYPKQLSELYPEYVPATNILRCPGSGSDEPGAGYIYAGDVGPNAAPDTVLLMDATASQHKKNNALVLFADGRIERVGIREHQYLLLQLD